MQLCQRDQEYPAVAVVTVAAIHFVIQNCTNPAFRLAGCCSSWARPCPAQIPLAAAAASDMAIGSLAVAAAAAWAAFRTVVVVEVVRCRPSFADSNKSPDSHQMEVAAAAVAEAAGACQAAEDCTDPAIHTWDCCCSDCLNSLAFGTAAAAAACSLNACLPAFVPGTSWNDRWAASCAAAAAAAGSLVATPAAAAAAEAADANTGLDDCHRADYCDPAKVRTDVTNATVVAHC